MAEIVCIRKPCGAMMWPSSPATLLRRFAKTYSVGHSENASDLQPIYSTVGTLGLFASTLMAVSFRNQERRPRPAEQADIGCPACPSLPGPPIEWRATSNDGG